MVNSGFIRIARSRGELPVFSTTSVRFNLSAVSTFTSRAYDAGPTPIPSLSIRLVENDSRAFTVKITDSVILREGSV